MHLKSDCAEEVFFDQFLLLLKIPTGCWYSCLYIFHLMLI